MPIQLVVFDMAGTTVNDDNNVAFTLQAAMEQFGFSVSIEDVNVVMGYPKPEAIAELLRKFTSGHVDIQLVQDIHEVFVERMISFYKNSPLISEKEGVTSTFRRLKENGIKVAIDTGFSRDIADVILHRMGWNEALLIDVSIASDEVERGRPYPDMIYRAMELLQIGSAKFVAKVGDTVSDLQEGKAAGCRYVIGITTGSYSRKELEKVDNTHLIDDIAQVADIVLEELALQMAIK